MDGRVVSRGDKSEHRGFKRGSQDTVAVLSQRCVRISLSLSQARAEAGELQQVRARLHVVAAGQN